MKSIRKRWKDTKGTLTCLAIVFAVGVLVGMGLSARLGRTQVQA